MMKFCTKFLCLFLLCLNLSAHDGEHQLPVSSLFILTTEGSSYSFQVEVAASPMARNRGLMLRESLDANHGMLFDFGQAMEVTMWMKDTRLSLDMLFIEEDGTISLIRESVPAMSLEKIHSRGVVRAVLELSAGTAGKYGISPGDRVLHSLFEK